MNTPKSVLKKKGIRPLKRLGQSFLQDRNIVDKIVALADIRDDEAVAEIGAGVGVMTEQIARKAGMVLALEIDPYMIEILKSSLAALTNVEIVHTDILDYDFSEASARYAGKVFKVIGNVPYNISSPILFHLLHYREFIGSMILMFQKEVADRIAARPGTKEYGIPTVILSMFAEVTHSFIVPAGCFYPRPKVTSCVVKMEMRRKPLISLSSDSFFCSVVRSSFAQRRKTILNNLKRSQLPGVSEDAIIGALAESEIDGGRRGETLSPVEFGILSNALLARANQ
jgi:16S rRNA (adenine1518-N6/adenine1519-N6)-dimethyltransferase